MDVQMIPLAAHESAMARDHKVIKWLAIGWAASMLMMGATIYSYANAEWEYTTETTTTETTTETVDQDSGDSGYNIYAGEDVNGYPTGDENNG